MAKRFTLPDDLQHDGEVRDVADDDVPAECLAPSGCAIEYNRGAILQSTDGNAMSAQFAIVTRQKEPNRYGNMVQITPGTLGLGLRTEDWEANPVVLWDHGFSGLSLPIGNAQAGGTGKVAIKKSSTKALSTVFFSQTLPDAAAIYGLVDEKILRMASIGYYPELVIALKQKAKKELQEGVEDISAYRWRGLDIVQSEMFEWSITAVGADRGSLRQTIERGSVNGCKLTAPIIQSLSRLAEKPKVWAPGIAFTQAVVGSENDAERVTISGTPEAIATFMRQTPVDTKPATGTTHAIENDPVAEVVPDVVAQAAAVEPVLTGEQLAAAFESSRNQTQLLQAAGNELEARLKAALDEKLKPIAEKQTAFDKRLNQMLGKLD
jgi:F0F1-type ATP synthase membrane subunit c/vacuolar-type H+-ATPase subunit K